MGVAAERDLDHSPLYTPQMGAAAEKDLDHSLLHTPRMGVAAEKDPDHSPLYIPRMGAAAERDPDHLPKLLGPSYMSWTSSQHALWRYSEDPSLQSKQATLIRLQIETSTYILRAEN
jgi:hypothetical protein